MRTSRYFPAHCLFEIALRTRRGLPFAAKQTIELLLKSAMARTQTDSKVTLCHFLWMSNHVHLLVIGKDASQLKAFYGEVQKRVTDYLKRLLGMDSLTLWEGDPSVLRVLDFDAAKHRIAYFYANPARAHLVDSIDKYPGFSSYQAFINSEPNPDASVSEQVPWIKCPAIPNLHGHDLSELRDQRLALQLKESTKDMETFEIFPHAWVRCFGVEEKETIIEAKERTLSVLREYEREAREDRARKELLPLGAKRLRAMRIRLNSYVPKKSSRKVFVVSTCNKLRMQYISHVHSVIQLCRECYERWKRADFNFSWPRGHFLPACLWQRMHSIRSDIDFIFITILLGLRPRWRRVVPARQMPLGGVEDNAPLVVLGLISRSICSKHAVQGDFGTTMCSLWSLLGCTNQTRTLVKSGYLIPKN